MSKREIRVSKQHAAEQKLRVSALKQMELKRAEANLFYVAFIALLAFISGSN